MSKNIKKRELRARIEGLEQELATMKTEMNNLTISASAVATISDITMRRIAAMLMSPPQENESSKGDSDGNHHQRSRPE